MAESTTIPLTPNLADPSQNIESTSSPHLDEVAAALSSLSRAGSTNPPSLTLPANQFQQLLNSVLTLHSQSQFKQDNPLNQARLEKGRPPNLMGTKIN
jgi:hypothetical protein